MTKRESETAIRLLGPHVDRTERCGADVSGGWCVTAHWRQGGQTLFWTLESVRQHLADRSQESPPR